MQQLSIYLRKQKTFHKDQHNIFFKDITRVLKSNVGVFDFKYCFVHAWVEISKCL